MTVSRFHGARHESNATCEKQGCGSSGHDQQCPVCLCWFCSEHRCGCPAPEPKACQQCEGTGCTEHGYGDCTRCGGSGHEPKPAECVACDGRGWILANCCCSHCGGSGHEYRRQHESK